MKRVFSGKENERASVDERLFLWAALEVSIVRRGNVMWRRHDHRPGGR